MKRVFVSLPDGVWKLIDQNFRGAMGEGDSEVIRNMIIAYISDQGYFLNAKGEPIVEDVYNKLSVLDKMITSLAELLEEKGEIKYDQWEKRTTKKIESTGHAELR